MIYWFRVYGTGWIICNNKKVAIAKHNEYVANGKCKSPLFHARQNWIKLD